MIHIPQQDIQSTSYTSKTYSSILSGPKERSWWKGFRLCELPGSIVGGGNEETPGKGIDLILKCPVISETWDQCEFWNLLVLIYFFSVIVFLKYIYI